MSRRSVKFLREAAKLRTKQGEITKDAVIRKLLPKAKPRKVALADAKLALAGMK